MLALGLFGCALANKVEDETSLLQVSKKSDRDSQLVHNLFQRSEGHAIESMGTRGMVDALWGKNPSEAKTETLSDGRTRAYSCELSMIGKCFKGKWTTSSGQSPSPSSNPVSPSPGPSAAPSPSPSPSPSIPTSFPATSKFSPSQKSFFTGKVYSTRTDTEKKIASELGRVRQQGFTCTSTTDSSKTITYAPAPHKLKFDCRLWWTCLLHSEDMTIRKYYDHYTLPGTYSNVTSGQTGTFTKLSPMERSDQWAWGMPSHVEIILAYPIQAGSINDADYAQKVVQAWLDSPPHCNGIGTSSNQLVGVGGVWCPKSDQKSVCQSLSEEDADGTGRWYWTALFTYTLPAADKYVNNDFSIKSAQQPSPRIREIGGDESCFT